MDEIKVYFFTIFKVFLLLSSIFIIFTVIKYSRTKSKNKRNPKISRSKIPNFCFFIISQSPSV